MENTCQAERAVRNMMSFCNKTRPAAGNCNTLKNPHKKAPHLRGFKAESERLSATRSVVFDSDCGYVNSSRAFLTVLNFKLNVLAFSQSFEAVTLDRREVYKHIFAAVSRSNETKTFRFVEPLNLTFDLRHLQNSLESFLRPQALT